MELKKTAFSIHDLIMTQNPVRLDDYCPKTKPGDLILKDDMFSNLFSPIFSSISGNESPAMKP